VPLYRAALDAGLPRYNRSVARYAQHLIADDA